LAAVSSNISSSNSSNNNNNNNNVQATNVQSIGQQSAASKSNRMSFVFLFSLRFRFVVFCVLL